MHLELSAEQHALRDNVREVLDRESPPSVARELVENGSAPEQLWSQLTQLGWPGLAIAEEYGGVGLGFVELTIVVEELGRHLTPGPFMATVTQFAGFVDEAGDDAQRKELLGAVAAGSLTGAVAIAEHPATWSPVSMTTTARRSGDGWVLDGMKHAVPDAATADVIAVTAQTDAGCGVFVVPRAALAVTPTDVVDRTRPWGTVELAGVPVGADRALVPSDGDTAVRRAVERATVALAAETVGTCQAILDTALGYAKVREQFGVPIGSFQAVKHRLADLHLAVERARACTYFAAAAIAENDERRSLAAHMAKAAAGDCERTVAQEGIQLMGGIGYTWEHDMQLFAKRAKSAGALYGSASWHRAQVARAIGLRAAP